MAAYFKGRGALPQRDAGGGRNGREDSVCENAVAPLARAAGAKPMRRVRDAGTEHKMATERAVKTAHTCVDEQQGQGRSCITSNGGGSGKCVQRYRRRAMRSAQSAESITLVMGGSKPHSAYDANGSEVCLAKAGRERKTDQNAHVEGFACIRLAPHPPRKASRPQETTLAGARGKRAGAERTGV